MTAAQLKARANFKKAIAYRTKTGCSLKEAFAYVKGNKVTGLDKVVKKGNKTTVLYTKKAKKKAAPKKKVSQGVLFGVKKKAAKNKAISTHKDTKSHNVNIRVMSGTEKTKFYL
jgi:IS5 family transposase